MDVRNMCPEGGGTVFFQNIISIYTVNFEDILYSGTQKTFMD